MLSQDFIQSDYNSEACQADPRPHQHPHLPPRSHSPLPITSERAWAGTPSVEGPRSLPDSGRASPCMRDGEFFLRLLQTEVERMEGWCQNMEREAEENELQEESEFGRRNEKITHELWIITLFICCLLFFLVLELIRNAVGSAQMLMSQKVQQFFRLCQQSVVSMRDCMRNHYNTHYIWWVVLPRFIVAQGKFALAGVAVLEKYVSLVHKSLYITLSTITCNFLCPWPPRTLQHTPSPPLRTWQVSGTCYSST